MQLKDVFPLKGKITKKILAKANIWDNSKCVGARALRRALKRAGFFDQATYGRFNGHISVGERYLTVQAYDSANKLVNMMGITKPMKVVFRLAD